MPRVHHQGWMVTTHGDDVITVKLFKSERGIPEKRAHAQKSRGPVKNVIVRIRRIAVRKNVSMFIKKIENKRMQR